MSKIISRIFQFFAFFIFILSLFYFSNYLSSKNLFNSYFKIEGAQAQACTSDADCEGTGFCCDGWCAGWGTRCFTTPCDWWTETAPGMAFGTNGCSAGLVCCDDGSCADRGVGCVGAPPTCEEAGYTCTPSCDPGDIVGGYSCSGGGFCCSSGPLPTPGGPTPTPGGPTPTPNPNLPSIISLVIKNPAPTPVFQGLFGFSGNMTTQSGSGWFNPMEITVNARPGTGSFLIGYVLAFYSGAKLENASTFLTDVANRLNPYVGGNPKNGFLFYYDPILSNFSIWDKTEFKLLTRQVKDTSGNLLMTGYKVGASSIFSNPGYTTWKMTLDKNFGSKTMYTAVYVIDAKYFIDPNQIDFKSNITPQNN